MKNIKNKPKKGNQIKDKDLEKAAGGSVSKLIFYDGSVEYRANVSVNKSFGKVRPPTGWHDGFDGMPSNRFKNREDAEKYAKEQGWATDFHTFREHIEYSPWGSETWWTKE